MTDFALYTAVLIGIAAALWGIYWVVSRFIDAMERDDDVAEAIAALSEYDDFGAPEGGKPR